VCRSSSEVIPSFVCLGAPIVATPMGPPVERPPRYRGDALSLRAPDRTGAIPSRRTGRRPTPCQFEFAPRLRRAHRNSRGQQYARSDPSRPAGPPPICGSTVTRGLLASGAEAFGLFRSVHLGETNCDGLRSPIPGASGAESIAVADPYD
jgi:hypothetical protein